MTLFTSYLTFTNGSATGSQEGVTPILIGTEIYFLSVTL